MIRWPLVPIVLLVVVYLLVLGLLFDPIPSYRRFASLCRFISLGVILGAAAGIFGEFAYDFIERWLFRTLPIPLARVIDFMLDVDYAPALGIVSGAAWGIWFWYVRPNNLARASVPFE